MVKLTFTNLLNPLKPKTPRHVSQPKIKNIFNVSSNTLNTFTPTVLTCYLFKNTMNTFYNSKNRTAYLLKPSLSTHLSNLLERKTPRSFGQARLDLNLKVYKLRKNKNKPQQTTKHHNTTQFFKSWGIKPQYRLRRRAYYRKFRKVQKIKKIQKRHYRWKYRTFIRMIKKKYVHRNTTYQRKRLPFRLVKIQKELHFRQSLNVSPSKLRKPLWKRKRLRCRQKRHAVKTIFFLTRLLSRSTSIESVKIKALLRRVKHRRKRWRSIKRLKRRFILFNNDKFYHKLFNIKRYKDLAKIEYTLLRRTGPATQAFSTSTLKSSKFTKSMQFFLNRSGDYFTKYYPFLHTSKFVKYKYKTSNLKLNGVNQIHFVNTKGEKCFLKFKNLIFNRSDLFAPQVTLTYHLKNFNYIESFDNLKDLNSLKIKNKKNISLIHPLLGLPWTSSSQKLHTNTSRVSSGLERTRYYELRRIRLKTIYNRSKPKTWLLNKFSLEYSSFAIHTKRTTLKFQEKKVRWAKSAFRMKHFYRIALKRRYITAHAPFSRTYDLVSDIGVMRPIPMYDDKDLPGFLLNYDTNIIYKWASYLKNLKRVSNTNSFLASTATSFDFYSCQFWKGDSYFELNNVFLPNFNTASSSPGSPHTPVKGTDAYMAGKQASLYINLRSIPYTARISPFVFKRSAVGTNSKYRRRKFKNSDSSFFTPRFKKRQFFKLRRYIRNTFSKTRDKMIKDAVLTPQTNLFDVLRKKTALFRSKVSISTYLKKDKVVRRFWKGNAKRVLKSHRLYFDSDTTYFDSVHRSNLFDPVDKNQEPYRASTFPKKLTLKPVSLHEPETIFELLFANFTKFNKFLFKNAIFLKLMNNRLFFKNFLFKINEFLGTRAMMPGLIEVSNRDIGNFFFNERLTTFEKSNILPLSHFNFEIKRFVVKHVRGGLWLLVSTQVVTTLLIRFVENIAGRKALLRFTPNAFKYLTLKDHARAVTWEPRIRGTHKFLGQRFYAAETLKLIGVMLRARDPYFFTRWLVIVAARLDFFKHRRFFRLVRLLLKWYYSLFFDEFGITGMKLKFKGKISVAGNSRTRTQFSRAGITSNSKTSNRVTSDINYIYTFTGAVAFQIWIYY